MKTRSYETTRPVTTKARRCVCPASLTSRREPGGERFGLRGVERGAVLDPLERSLQRPLDSGHGVLREELPHIGRPPRRAEVAHRRYDLGNPLECPKLLREHSPLGLGELPGRVSAPGP